MERNQALGGQSPFLGHPIGWYENNPLSVIEAQCLGTPVLGARIGGIPELISEETGMTFESRHTADLKEKIEAMYGRTFNNAKIAAASHKRYNAERYYNEIITVYKM